MSNWYIDKIKKFWKDNPKLYKEASKKFCEQYPLKCKPFNDKESES